MFGKLKNIFGGSNDLSIPAPVAGTAIPLSEVSDPTFSQGILGKGCAIRPSSGRVVAPVDATVSMIFETGHAVSLELSAGVELLIHVGLNIIRRTVQTATRSKPVICSSNLMPTPSARPDMTQSLRLSCATPMTLARSRQRPGRSLNWVSCSP